LAEGTVAGLAQLLQHELLAIGGLPVEKVEGQILLWLDVP
jgi:hypothetical protein